MIIICRILYSLLFFIFNLNFNLYFALQNPLYSSNSRQLIRKSNTACNLLPLHGLDLGITTLSTGLIMDNTISNNSLVDLKNKNITLYNQGLIKSSRNLLFLGPFYYSIVENLLITDKSTTPNLLHTFSIVFIHSIGYYFAHKAMHRNDFFKKYHYFHHQFNETLIPTIANSVSETEFTMAYMLPFVVGSLLISPNIESFNLGIMIVSIMNLVIHCQELQYTEWNKFFVSPKTHLYHHQAKNNISTYSAPTFNLENIFSNSKEKT